MSVEALRSSSLFADLAEDDLQRLLARAERVIIAPGELLIEEGTPGDAFFVVLDGQLEVTKRSGDADLPLAVVGRGAIQGEMAVLEGTELMASVRAVQQTEVLRIPGDVLRDLLAASPEAALGMLRTVIARLRSTELLLREREKLAGLGTLAAGLAHELNNPAAAIRRSVAALSEAIATRDALPPPPPGLQAAAALAGERPKIGPLERADRIDELAALVGDTESAAALVDAGWDPKRLDAELAGLTPDERRDAAAWLAAHASVRSLLGEVRISAERISEIVGAVRDYAYLDQAPVQRIDVRNGIEKTLVILSHRLKEGVSVMRDYADDVPQIEAYGSELNQVWTNLIGNAIDAMGGRGELGVRVEPDGDGVRVTICNTGQQIPPEIRERLFEPFFTTKPPGVGTGLGLHISHNVVARHGGRIEVTSESGQTCFSVCLPALLPKRP